MSTKAFRLELVGPVVEVSPSIKPGEWSFETVNESPSRIVLKVLVGDEETGARVKETLRAHLSLWTEDADGKHPQGLTLKVPRFWLCVVVPEPKR